MEEPKKYADKYCQRILIGNKSDLERVVSYDVAYNFANSLDIPYYEISTKTGGKEIREALMGISRKILEQNDMKDLKQSEFKRTKLSATSSKQTSCCGSY